ncbi:T9SS type A sorting domain-containing protein [Coprobacter secundus]|uniref:T9SS type A sorting domain-containing protein n=1 Tax=Coprobacter secundus TaxID=1501392 RepID=UPI00190E5D06
MINSLLSIDICPEPNSFVIIDIYDLNGNKIATIYNGRTTNSQVNQQEWNYGNIQPGIYLVRYIVNSRINIEKIIIK